MSRLFAFGLGFSALALARRLSAKGWQIAGTARDEGKIEGLEREGYDAVRFAGEARNEALVDHLSGTTQLLHSIPPSAKGDPVLASYREAIAALPSLAWIGYLSTVGVYGEQCTYGRPRRSRAGLAPVRAGDRRSGARVPARGHLRARAERLRQA